MTKEAPEVIEAAPAVAVEVPQTVAPAPVEAAASEGVTPAPKPAAPARRSAAKPVESTPPAASAAAAKPAPKLAAPKPAAPKPASVKAAPRPVPAAPEARSFRVSWNLEPYAATALFDTMLDIGAELQSFTAERVREDVATQHRILHCKTPADLLHIQSAFFQKASEDYRAHWGRLAELGNKLAVFPA